MNDEFLSLLAHTFPVDLNWLLSPSSEGEEPREIAQGMGKKPFPGDAVIGQHEYSAIPVYEVDAAAGNGVVPLSEAAPESLAFTRAWLMRHSIAADLAGIVRVRGDSMAPTIPDGSHILVDFRARAEARPAGVCILRHDGAILVKRLVWPQNPGERWVALASDNPAYAPVVVPDPERPAFEPLARVRAVISVL